MKKNNDRLGAIIAFAISFIPRFIICFINPTQMRLIPDEIGFLAGTAYFAGLDWSAVVSHTAYYGIGYHILFAPLLAIVDDFVVFHFVLRLVASLLCSFVALMAYHIMTSFFDVKDVKFKCIVAIICSYCMSIGIRNISNEYIIIFINWLIVFLLLKLNRNDGARNGKRLGYTMLLVVAMLYSLTIHTRNIIVCGAVVFVVCFYFLVYKKKLVDFWAFGGSIVVGYLGIRKIEKFVQNEIWISDGTGGALRNTSSDLLDMIIDGIGGILNPYNIDAAFKLLFGNIYTILYFTGGLMIVATVIFVGSIKSHITANKKFEMESLRAKDMVFWFSISCVVVTVLGLAVTWYPGISKAIQGYDLDVYAYFYKAIVYSRYYASYLSPCLMICAIYLKENTGYASQKFGLNMLFILVLSLYWIKQIVYCIVDYAPCVREFVALTFQEYDSNNVNVGLYIPAMIFLFVCVIIMTICSKKKKENIYLLLIMIFMMYSRIYYDIEITTSKYPAVDAGTSYVFDLEEKGIVDRQQLIYVPSIAAAYAYQALLNKYSVIPEYPTEEVECALVFVNQHADVKQLQEWGYIGYELDENEWVWIKGIDVDEYF